MTTAAPDTVVDLLQTMVRFNTVNANYSSTATPEAPLCSYLETLAKEMGFETRRMPVPGQCDNLLVTHRVAEGKPWLLFESHMDTVVVDGMTVEPFAAKIEGGRMWGRGSCDTKGTGAAMLWALQQYAALPGGDKRNNIAVAFTVDEEYGMTGVRALIKAWPTLGFKPAGVIVGEPTMLQPIVAHNGAVRWRITTRGVAAHAANPTKGRSAIADMVKVIEAVESQYIAKLSATNEYTGKSVCTINMIRGGVQINIVPAECEIRLDRRVVPGEDSESVLPVVQRVLEALREKEPKLVFEQEAFFTCPPLGTKNNTGLLATVQRALRAKGHNPAPIGVPFSTDAGDLDKVGIPAIVIGPGDIAQAHTKDEFIALDQLELGVELYLELMKQPLA